MCPLQKTGMTRPRNTPIWFASLFLLAWSSWLAAQEGTKPPAQRVYIVQLVEPAAISEPQVARSARREGRFDAHAGAVRRYAADLAERHDELLAAVGADADAKIYSYRLAFNGFAARLTAEQAAALAADPAVARVWEDRTRKLRTNASASFLGLTDPASGLREARGLSGENIIIGVIDSGITPGHPSFADRAPGQRPRACRSEWGEQSLLGRWLCRRFKKRVVQLYEPPVNWYGQCEVGPGFSASDCNNKVIGARFYSRGFRAIYDMDANEFMSPRDADGHGTHIASVAAGHRVMAKLGDKEVASISGMAPRSRIAVYKACWLQPGATRGSCAMSDLQQAIEDAIADGVDIINYSIGTSDGSPADPDALALLAAADVGVLAVVAAGNNGPLAASIESPGSAPWVLTVGAASRAGPRFDTTLRVTAPDAAAADIATREASFTPTLREIGEVKGKLVLADDGVPAVDSSQGTRDDACQALRNGADFQDRIALIRRGGCTFQDKIVRAEAAGALAVVVFNNDPGAIITMSGTRGSVDIPAVMIGANDGEALAARLRAAETVEVRLDKGLIVTRTETGNVLARQSSRGANPDVADVLKPDVVAPGTDILGAHTPDVANGLRGEYYQYLTGTSMAVPHVAGIAALLMEAHPGWSPAAIRSALVTTARQNLRKDDGITPADAFDAGGGYIVPNAAADPGLVFDAGSEDYDAFACGAGIARLDEAGCNALIEAGYPTEPWELNLPSVALGDLVAGRLVRRYVTNVGPPAQYQATFSAPPGVNATVSPAVLNLASGETAEFTVMLTNRGEAQQLGNWGFGSITWNGDGRTVRVPLAVRPWWLAAPDLASGSGTSGTAQFEVQFGYSGSFTVHADGLAGPEIYSGFVTDDPLNLYAILEDDNTLPDHVHRLRINVPEGTRYLRIGLAGSDEGATDDLDLYVFCPDELCPNGGSYIASATLDPAEVVDILDPAPGEYVIDVHGYETDDVVAGPGANFEIGVWTVRSAGLSDFTATATTTASVGETVPVNLAWQGLEPGQVYLGLVTHGDGERLLGYTLVEIIAE